MMGVTHALIGLLLAVSAQYGFASFQFTAATAALAGGLFPDLDMVFNHRKTLHFPVIYTVLTAVLAPVMFSRPSTVSIAVFYFLLSAAVHSWIDIFGGGLEEKPWIPSSNRAVYSHVLGKWFMPKRWIRYDGAPEDLLLSLLLGIPLYFYYTDELVKGLILTLLAAGAVYVLVRKRIV
ncbi:MAG: metal-dependent hydrolase, partial [Candidatus Nanohalobium sp.]